MLALDPSAALDTPRLHLRRHRVEDFPACAALWADPVVTRHIGGKPATPEETWSRMLRYAGHWSLFRFGYWAIVERASGAFIGELGFADHRRDITPPLAVPELGWALASAAHGKGYGTEAVRAALAWADALWPLTTCIVDPGNAPSLHVARKCGFLERTRTTYHGSQTIILVRTR